MENVTFKRVCNFRSSAFRSHPLFPLLRDLVIADMNFHSPTFPFQVSFVISNYRKMYFLTSKFWSCQRCFTICQTTCHKYEIHEVTSLFQLISNLPADFNKLLQNYMQRNPASANYRMNEAMDNVIMDALRYAHKAFIGNILYPVKSSCWLSDYRKFKQYSKTSFDGLPKPKKAVCRSNQDKNHT